MNKYSLFFLASFSLFISFLSLLNIVYSYYFNLYLNLNSYFSSLIISLIIAILLFFIKAKDIKFSIYNKILTVVIGYLLFPILISLPYYFSIYNISFINSYFEAISGFTSTGFSIFDNIKQIDQSIILWRSTSQWIGGLYFLFSLLILIDIFDENIKKTLTNFFSFNSSEILKQSIKVFAIYLALTLFTYIILKFINFRDFDAFNFALTIISSGGFKPVNEIDYILNTNFKIIIFSLILLISFFSIFLTYNLLFLKNKYLNFFTEDLYLLIYLISLIFLFFIFFNKNNFPLLLFGITSSVSNIGIYFAKTNVELSFIFIIFVIIGGSLFSTSSGIRFFKIVTLFKFSINELLSYTKPKQVFLNKDLFNDSNINFNVINKYFLSILIFIVSLIVITALLSISGLSFINSFKIGSLTIMNTASSSLFNLENFDFYNQNNFFKSSLILFMIIGRVEFITILILLKKYLFKN